MTMALIKSHANSHIISNMLTSFIIVGCIESDSDGMRSTTVEYSERVKDSLQHYFGNVFFYVNILIT
jgi:hypothetical protein